MEGLCTTVCQKQHSNKARDWMAKEFGFNSQKWQEIFLLSLTRRLAIESTKPSVQWVLRPVSRGIKLQGLEADHSPLSNAKVKNSGGVAPFSHTSSWCSAE